MELNREQIIKALECCGEAKTHGDCRALKCPALINDECIYIGETEEDCYKQQLADALSLIKELTEENEGLENALIEQSAENVMLCGEVKHARADTVREFAERLKENKVCRDGLSFKVVDFDTIDQIAKEVLEGK